tara:strand:+ start:9930 stop:11192 length:1263 start_codon:yes stop_codon:yes gene_type:complete
MLMSAELADLLKSIVVLLFAAHLMGFLFDRLQMPRVVGEICGGFVLGPSCLGLFSSDLAEFLIPSGAQQEQLLSAFHWVGLTLLMFTAGFRIQHGLLTRDKKIVFMLLASATIFPFGAGWAATMLVDFGEYIGPKGDTVTFALVLAIAVAVTSIPVISRIFIDLDIIETRFAKIVLAVSTIQDILLWAVLAVAISLAEGVPQTGTDLAITIAKPLLFCIAGLLLGPIALQFLQKLRITSVIRYAKLGFALIWCFLIAQLAAVFDVNIVFGAFIAGVALGSLKPGQMEEEKEQISKFSLAFFIPLYFAVVGFSINLLTSFDLQLFVGFLMFSTSIEGICAFLAMRSLRFNRLTSFNFSVAMNTRGGPGIVLASVALGSGLIDDRMFVALVLTAVTTSIAAGAWFRSVVRRDLPLMDDAEQS